MTRLRHILAATAAMLAIAPAAGASELLTNGDFEAGVTGFYSSYANNQGDYHPPAIYAVTTNPQQHHESFTAFGDHTSGAGKMMVVNGTETANVVVWGEGPFAVAQDSDYTFSFWLSSVHAAAPGKLAVRINDIWLDAPEANAPGTTGLWTNFVYTWNSGDASTAKVELINRQLAYHGNDFALDDLSFTGPAAVPEPATWAMMIMGFGTAGAMLRRRRMTLAPVRAR